jgi:DNA-binding MarR family transcriptional regulator
METANKETKRNIVSRLSKVQKEILSYLAQTPQPEALDYGHRIHHLPRTGDIIDALGRPRTPSNYAAISKALKRLEERGLVSSYQSEAAHRGKGLAYALTVASLLPDASSGP